MPSPCATAPSPRPSTSVMWMRIFHRRHRHGLNLSRSSRVSISSPPQMCFGGRAMCGTRCALQLPNRYIYMGRSWRMLPSVFSVFSSTASSAGEIRPVCSSGQWIYMHAKRTSFLSSLFSFPGRRLQCTWSSLLFCPLYLSHCCSTAAVGFNSQPALAHDAPCFVLPPNI